MSRNNAGYYTMYHMKKAKANKQNIININRENKAASIIMTPEKECFEKKSPRPWG